MNSSYCHQGHSGNTGGGNIYFLDANDKNSFLFFKLGEIQTWYLLVMAITFTLHGPAGKQYKCVGQPLTTVANVIEKYCKMAGEADMHVAAFGSDGVPLRPQDYLNRSTTHVHIEHSFLPKRAAAHHSAALYDPEASTLPGWQPYATPYPAAIFSYTSLSPYAFTKKAV